MDIGLGRPRHHLGEIGLRAIQGGLCLVDVGSRGVRIGRSGPGYQLGQFGLGAGDSRLRGHDVLITAASLHRIDLGLRGIDLSLSSVDVLSLGTRQQDAELGLVGLEGRLGLSKGQHQIGRVEGSQDLAGLDTISDAHVDLVHESACLKRDSAGRCRAHGPSGGNAVTYVAPEHWSGIARDGRAGWVDPLVAQIARAGETSDYDDYPNQCARRGQRKSSNRRDRSFHRIRFLQNGRATTRLGPAFSISTCIGGRAVPEGSAGQFLPKF